MSGTDTAIERDATEILRLHREFVDANGPLDSSYLHRRATAAPDELVWYNLNGSVYLGLPHIAQLWDMLASVMVGQAVSSELRDERVEVIGDAAWVTYLSHYSADFGNLGRFGADMRSTEIWRRGEDTWELVHAHFSTHVPNQMGGR